MAVSTGVKVDLGSWTVGEDLIRRYLMAVEDGQPTYFKLGMAPPLALSAWALGSMLDSLALPPGAIHSRQELETHRGVRLGETIQCTGYLGEPTHRSGMRILTAGYTLTGSNGQQVQRGKSTVLAPTPDSAGPGPPGSPDSAQGQRGYREGASDPIGTTTSKADNDRRSDGLPVVSKTITQEQLEAYAAASGDDNPLHLDAEFAATTQFGGIIAHGMLTLAAISEMMTASFGSAWLETGGLNVRFRGAAYVGDRLESWGRVSKEEEGPGGRRLVCAVGVQNLRSGQPLITGTATARVVAS